MARPFEATYRTGSVDRDLRMRIVTAGVNHLLSFDSHQFTADVRTSKVEP